MAVVFGIPKVGLFKKKKNQNTAARSVTSNYCFETESMTGILEQLRWESQVKEERQLYWTAQDNWGGVWHNSATPLAPWNLVVEWTRGKGHCCQAFKSWKAGKGARTSYDAAKRNTRHAVHHARQEADKKVYENIDPKSSEVRRFANQFRRENTDVVGDKPVRNDAGEMSISEDSKQKAWLEHYQRLLNVEFDWDPDHLSYQPPVEGLPIPITIDMVKKAISQMEAGKAPDPSGIVVEMIRAAGDMGASMIRYLAAARGGGRIGKWQLPRSLADRAGYKKPGEDCGQPHQTVGVNRRFPVRLCPRQRHYRRSLCCQAATREISSCQQETLHSFRRPREGVCPFFHKIQAHACIIRALQRLSLNSHVCCYK